MNANCQVSKETDSEQESFTGFYEASKTTSCFTFIKERIVCGLRFCLLTDKVHQPLPIALNNF